MQHNLSTVVRMAACLVLALGFTAGAQDSKVDPTGTWKWSREGRDGQPRESTLTLKLDGEKLTGAISGRRGETPISNATLKGDELSFQLVREFNERTFTANYKAKISGDTLKGTIEMERGGEARTRDWEAKRVPAEAKEGDAE